MNAARHAHSAPRIVFRVVFALKFERQGDLNLHENPLPIISRPFSADAAYRALLELLEKWIRLASSATHGKQRFRELTRTSACSGFCARLRIVNTCEHTQCRSRGNDDAQRRATQRAMFMRH
jgi:hypothetical protein